ncbi:protein 4.1-like isoform X44 [Ptychodera flava]|uniref:protein 4.1-like isoform X44 n=1 Tax=Ptychodera flava TaxID=63121 RepID=UPI00396A80D5
MSTEGGPAGDTMETRQQQQSSPSKKSPEHKKAPQRQRMQLCRVLLLDGAEMDCEVEKKSKGQALFDKIAENLNIMEKDYFGITYRDAADQKYWLDPVKDMKKQIRSGAWVFSFNVKFYPPDPAQLQEDITRYYLVLQLRDDILKGKLPCSFVTHALLGSYIVQAEFGDYDPEEHGTDPTYLSDLRFAPNQTRELEEKIMELHKTHKGQTPAEAELHYLENAKKLAMYGVDLHHARDSEGVDIMLGVCANGLLIYRDRLRINRFAWPKILKISYKRNNFYIKIRPGEFEQFESTIGFKLANHRAAKRLWKVCVEHHTFFRLVQPEPPPKGKLFHLGSKFRYSGRTQFQTRQTNALIDRPAPQFERIASKRFHSLDGGYGAPRDQNRPDESKLGQVEPPVVDEAAPPPSERVPYLDSERPAEPEEGRPGEDDEEDKEDDGSPRKWGTAYETTTVTTTVTRSTEGHTVEGEPDQEPQPLEDESPKGERIDEHPEWGIGVTRYIGGDTYPYDKDKEDEGAVVVPDDDVPEDSDRIPEGYHVTKTYTTEEVPEYVEGEPGTHIIVTKKTTVVTSVSGTDDPDQVDYVQPVPQADAEDEEMVATPSFDVAPVVKTAALKYQPGEDDDTTATTDVPIVHTESKTITYESNETNEEPEPIDPGQLQSAQTITSETHTTTTTTHITKTVKGGVSETRVEKKIVIQGDANIDHDQALADAIKEATALNPDMTVTKVVVHKEGDEVVEEVSQDHVQENGEN